ncbi:hypothetical protein JTB14_029920 [Gonioctena quinquepunctata]|nr:hypothetical protein JTB14_029920 [Gonioctena quinquepunctata]
MVLQGGRREFDRKQCQHQPTTSNGNPGTTKEDHEAEVSVSSIEMEYKFGTGEKMPLHSKFLIVMIFAIIFTVGFLIYRKWFGNATSTYDPEM